MGTSINPHNQEEALSISVIEYCYVKWRDKLNQENTKICILLKMDTVAEFIGKINFLEIGNKSRRDKNEKR